MSFRDILAIIPASESDAHVLAFARQLAQQSGGRVSVLLVAWRPDVPMLIEGMSLAPIWQEQAEEAKKGIETRRKSVEAQLRQIDAASTVEALVVAADEARAKVALYVRHRDIAVVGRPAEDVLGDAHTPLIEGALFGSGRPLIVVPPGWMPKPIGARVAVGWNGSREAARAVADASPLLEQASNVTIVSVESEQDRQADRGAVALDVRSHFVRRGIEAEAKSIRATRAPEASAMLEELSTLQADLLVMGGYGRSRFAEMVFGGMTREMLRSTTVPLFFSH